MADFGIAIGLVLVIEGALYALFPAAMKGMMAVMMTKSNRSLSVAGLIGAMFGFVIVWLLRG